MQRANWHSLSPQPKFPLHKQLLGSHWPLLPGTCTELTAGLGNDCASQLTTRTLSPIPASSSRKGCSLLCCKSTECMYVCACVCVCVCKNPEKYCAAPLVQSRGKLGYSTVFGGFQSVVWKQILPKVTSSQWLVVQRGSNTVLLLPLNPRTIHLSRSLPHTKIPKQNKKKPQETKQE